MRRLLLIAVLALAACGPDEGSTLECEVGEVTETVDGVGATCSFDGECSGYLTCQDEACSLPEALSGESPHGTITIGDERYDYELASSSIARSRGLAGRPCLRDGWAMVLEWPEPGVRFITMEGMRFSLDLLWLDAEGRAAGAVRGAPPSERLYSKPTPARWVVELPAGSLPDPVPSVELD